MSQQEFETLLIQDQKPVLRVMLNRPKLANAMNLKMVNELMAVMEKVENENYRVLIISGGNGNFCAGGDIKDMQSAGADKQAKNKNGKTPFYYAQENECLRFNKGYLVVSNANWTPLICQK